MMIVIDCSIENVIQGLVELFIEAVCKREEIDWRCINCYEVEVENNVDVEGDNYVEVEVDNDVEVKGENDIEVDGDNDVYVEVQNYVELEGYNYVGVEVEFLMYVIIRKELWKN